MQVRRDSRARVRTWAPVLAIPPLWLAHVSGSYTATSLRCHDVALTGEALGLAAFRTALIALTVVAGGGVGAIFLALRRRRRSDDGDARLAVLIGTILAGIFAAYLIWSLIPIVAPESCT